MSLRRELAAFVAEHPEVEIDGVALADWVYWDKRCSPQAYSTRQAVSGDGGGIEIAIYARLKGRSVQVFERRGDGFLRIAHFPALDSNGTINLLYNGFHYDTLFLVTPVVGASGDPRSRE